MPNPGHETNDLFSRIRQLSIRMNVEQTVILNFLSSKLDGLMNVENTSNLKKTLTSNIPGMWSDD